MRARIACDDCRCRAFSRSLVRSSHTSITHTLHTCLTKRRSRLRHPHLPPLPHPPLHHPPRQSGLQEPAAIERDRPLLPRPHPRPGDGGGLLPLGEGRCQLTALVAFANALTHGEDGRMSRVQRPPRTEDAGHPLVLPHPTEEDGTLQLSPVAGGGAPCLPREDQQSAPVVGDGEVEASPRSEDSGGTCGGAGAAPSYGRPTPRTTPAALPASAAPAG